MARDLGGRFQKFHRENPQVFELFTEYALQLINAGRLHFGAQAVVERIRWYSAVETRGDIFKVNSDYAAFYSRLFEAANPAYAGFFRKRGSVADGVEDGDV